MRPKPKIVIDLKFGKDIFLSRPRLINLAFRSIDRPAFIRPFKALLPAILIVAAFFFGSVAAPTENLQAQTVSPAERSALEAELQQLEAEIAQYEQTIGEYQKQGTTLKNEISQLNAKINKVNLQIRSINLTLATVSQEITTTSGKIVQTEDDIENSKKMIAEAIKGIYESEDQNLLEIFLENPKLSDFFGNINNLMAVQDNLRISLKNLSQLREEYLNEKEQLSLQKSDAENLRLYQQSQKASIEEMKGEKNTLLKETQGKEENYQKILAEKRKSAAEIRSRLYEMIGGGEMTFAEAYDLAKFAERATGIRAAMLLAVLDRESALGKNVGRCDYQTAMHPTRDIPSFLQIINELNLTANLQAGLIKVSCPIYSDGAYGGAMGPAQFIPSTWNLFKDRIGQLTGHRPASPWNNLDAFVGTSLYLKDAYDSAACLNYSQQIPSQSQSLRERCAAAKYYAGSRWYTYRFTYGEAVLSRAASFQKDIDIISD
jgi:peptidoglycan hydrolase CwlO-like protein